MENDNTEFPINYPLFTIRLPWDSEKIFHYFMGSSPKWSGMKSYFRREHPDENLAPSSRERVSYTLGTAHPETKKKKKTLSSFLRHPLVLGSVLP